MKLSQSDNTAARLMDRMVRVKKKKGKERQREFPNDVAGSGMEWSGVGWAASEADSPLQKMKHQDQPSAT